MLDLQPKNIGEAVLSVLPAAAGGAVFGFDTTLGDLVLISLVLFVTFFGVGVMLCFVAAFVVLYLLGTLMGRPELPRRLPPPRRNLLTVGCEDDSRTGGGQSPGRDLWPPAAPVRGPCQVPAPPAGPACPGRSVRARGLPVDLTAPRAGAGRNPIRRATVGPTSGFAALRRPSRISGPFYIAGAGQPKRPYRRYAVWQGSSTRTQTRNSRSCG